MAARSPLSITPPALDDFTPDEAFDDWEGWSIAEAFGIDAAITDADLWESE